MTDIQGITKEMQLILSKQNQAIELAHKRIDKLKAVIQDVMLISNDMQLGALKTALKTI